jgi:hypothetical protein
MAQFKSSITTRHSFRRYGTVELICHCGYVAPFYKLPEQQAQLDAWLKSERGLICFGLHHTEVSRLVGICKADGKIDGRWSWNRQAETALRLTGNLEGGAPQKRWRRALRGRG